MPNEKHLSDVSPKDKPWDKQRNFADLVQELYSQIDYLGYSVRIAQCALILEFALAAATEGEFVYRLQSAKFCRCRHCPVCQWRRSLMWKARFFQVLPKLRQDYPTARYLFLTLTVRNCPLDELRQTLTHMNKSWQRLSERKVFPAIGWAKSVEVTRGEDGSAHPHFHVLMMVPAGYFSTTGGYLNHEKWTELWQKSLRIDYLPIVHITAIKPQLGDSMDTAIKETFKYSVKSSDLVYSPEFLKAITDQLHKTRAIALGGIFRDYLSDHEPEDLINTDETESEIVSDDRFYFGWREALKHYVCIRSTDSENCDDNSQSR